MLLVCHVPQGREQKSCRTEPISRSTYGFCHAESGAVITSPFLGLSSSRPNHGHRWHRGRAEDICTRGLRETLLAPAALSTPGWGGRSTGSAARGAAHA